MPGMIVSKATDALQIWADILTTFAQFLKIYSAKRFYISPISLGLEGFIAMIKDFSTLKTSVQF